MAPSWRTLRMCSLSGSPATSTAVSPSALEKKKTNTDNHIKGSFLKRPQVHGLGYRKYSNSSVWHSLTSSTPQFCGSIYLSVCQSLCLLVCPSVGPLVCLSIGLSTCLSICLSFGFLSLFVCLPACLSVCWLVCLPVLLSVCRPVWLSVYLIISLYSDIYLSSLHLSPCLYASLPISLSLRWSDFYLSTWLPQFAFQQYVCL